MEMMFFWGGERERREGSFNRFGIRYRGGVRMAFGGKEVLLHYIRLLTHFLGTNEGVSKVAEATCCFCTQMWEAKGVDGSQ